MLSVDTLKKYLYYDPETGLFSWVRPRQGVIEGKSAGYIRKDGYCVIRIEGVGYRAHRLAFLYMTGTFPAQQVDHINGVRDDNRWCNLRQATPVVNGKNTALRADNTSGVMGVSWATRESKWLVQIRRNKRTAFVGYFSKKDAAIKARLAAEKQEEYHENHGRMHVQGEMKRK